MSLTFLISSFVHFFGSLFTFSAYSEGVVGDVLSIHPLNSSTDAEQTITRLVYRSLFTYDQEGNLVKDLVKEYEISEDGLTYSVTLKENLYWHNGNTITADDILYTSSKAKNLREISTDKIDDKTVRFHLPNPYSPFLSVLTIPIAPQNSESTNNFYVNGSGDFRVIRVKRGREGLKEISLYTKNNKYEIKKINFKMYKSENELFLAYKLGHIDGFISDSVFDWPNLLRFRLPIFGRYYVLNFNTSKEPFNNIENRKLASKSINYTELFDSVLKPIYKKAYGIISNSWATKEDTDYLNYDSSLEVLENPIDIQVLSADSQIIKEVMGFIESEWQKVGIKANITYLSPQEVLSKTSQDKDYDLLVLGQEVGRDPDRYVFWHSTQTESPGLNFSNYSNLRVDKSLELGRQVIEKEERAKHYNILQTVMIEEYPAIFLFHPGFYYHISEKFNVPEIKEIFYPYERFKNFKDWGFRKE